jgi:hypothetical protein
MIRNATKNMTVGDFCRPVAKSFEKTVFCRSVTGEGGCLAVGGKCRFAHTIEEIRPRLCRYGDRCNRHKDHPKNCNFVHPDESIYDYAKTHGFSGNVTVTRVVVKPTMKQVTVDFSFKDDDFPDLTNGFSKKRKLDDEETSCDRSDGYDSIDGVNWSKEQGSNGFAVLVHGE